MILVDIQLLQLGEVYDFELDDSKKTDELIAEIVTLICKKENIKPGEKSYYLYAMNKACILTGNLSLGEQGIRDGERLVLI